MAGFVYHIRGGDLPVVATLSFYEKEPVLRKKQTERGSELSFCEKEPVLTKKETK